MLPALDTAADCKVRNREDFWNIPTYWEFRKPVIRQLLPAQGVIACEIQFQMKLASL